MNIKYFKSGRIALDMETGISVEIENKPVSNFGNFPRRVDADFAFGRGSCVVGLVDDANWLFGFTPSGLGKVERADLPPIPRGRHTIKQLARMVLESVIKKHKTGWTDDLLGCDVPQTAVEPAEVAMSDISVRKISKYQYGREDWFAVDIKGQHSFDVMQSKERGGQFYNFMIVPPDGDVDSRDKMTSYEHFGGEVAVQVAVFRKLATKGWSPNRRIKQSSDALPAWDVEIVNKLPSHKIITHELQAENIIPE